MNMIFRPASRQKSKLRMAIDGPAGSGKTFTALRFAFAIAGPAGRVAVINSESGAVEKYLGLSPDGIPFQFDVCELEDFAPTKYTEAIFQAGQAGYSVLVIDSLSHAWAGSGGALEIKDRKSGGSNANSFTAWKDVTPMHNAMIDAILRSPCHIIATMRSKTEYVIETDNRGRSIPRKVGMAPVQRAGMEYEFDLYCSIDEEHILRVSKSRCPELADGMSVKPGASFIAPILPWLNDGSDAPADRFAVTEADLARLQRAQEGDKPAPPPKTAMELMREAAAKEQAAARAEGKGVESNVDGANPPPAAVIAEVAKSPDPAPQTTAVAPQATAPATREVDGDSTQTQRDRINDLYRALNIGPEAQAAILAKRGLSVLRSLSAEQAAVIITNLESKLPHPALQAAATAPTSSTLDAMTAAPGSTLANTHRQDLSGPCTSEQIKELKDALIEWEQVQPGISEQFIAAMQSAGFANFAAMSAEQAARELAAIHQKNAANFFEGLRPVAVAG